MNLEIQASLPQNWGQNRAEKLTHYFSGLRSSEIKFKSHYKEKKNIPFHIKYFHMFLSYLNNKCLKTDLSGPEFSRYKSQFVRSGEMNIPWVPPILYEGWNFNSGNYLFTTDTK